MNTHRKRKLAQIHISWLRHETGGLMKMSSTNDSAVMVHSGENIFFLQLREETWICQCKIIRYQYENGVAQ